MDVNMAISKLKKLPFSKSWQNTYISKTKKKIVNKRTGSVEETEIDVFVYIPANVIIQHWGTDREFLAFRQEHKLSSDFNYNLLKDKTENNNRRLAVMYAAQFFNEAEIDFLVDDNYTLYITGEELHKLQDSDEPVKKDFYNALYIPKHFGGRKGSEETWSN